MQLMYSSTSVDLLMRHKYSSVFSLVDEIMFFFFSRSRPWLYWVLSLGLNPSLATR